MIVRLPAEPLFKTDESSQYRRPITDEEWTEISAALKHRLSGQDSRTIEPWLRSIAQSIGWLDAVMTRFCQQTCPRCEDPCCSGKGVFFNQADLIAAIAGRGTLSPGQTRTTPSEECRYLSPTGCRLSRLERPYVCVWFTCEAQMALFGTEPPSMQRRYIRELQNVRENRLRLEAWFEAIPLSTEDYPRQDRPARL